ncbi:uncharacterized protein LOC126236440 [Schistocerca nitens]|uniref:uncharacterized protein LOC126236440 n=1 Tax=Schistocerca nitens TaxID=7011 RepID=UPI0021175768|nr:uncharacterized protein LOC126236440 [Schistocerca nitens]
MDFTEKCHPPQIDYTPVQNPSPVQSPAQYFSEYFSEYFFENAAKFTNMYSVAKSGTSLDTTAREIKLFFGINLIMRCTRYPRLPMNWQKSISQGAVSDSTSRDHFLALQYNIHFVDTVAPPQDAQTNRPWKIQPLIEAVREMPYFIPYIITALMNK